MAYIKEAFAANNEISVFDKPIGRQKVVNKVLLGTWLGVVDQTTDYYEVETAGQDGWVRKSDITTDKHLKIYYIDVGQGDGTLIEIGNIKILIDGGPKSNVHDYLSKWQYSYDFDDNKTVHIDHVIVSHFDADHYFGLTDIINDKRFTFGTVYHNGIARFNTKKGKRLDQYNQDLGTTETHNNEEFLITVFDDLDSLKNLKKLGGFQRGFGYFVEALIDAENQNRLNSVKMLTNQDGTLINQLINQQSFVVDILGPVRNKVNGNMVFRWFKDSSHTRNGHSVVVKMTYGSCSMLFGGDLNEPSEIHLLDHYKPNNPFRVDVAKSCHHGSSDFTIDFLKEVRPFATVISSGDNENYSHPRADTIGCSGKYSRGVRPKVYSTELARSINASNEVLYGMINLRCDGRRIYMAQMKEKRSGADIWDSYKIK